MVGFGELIVSRISFDGLVMVVDILNSNYRHLKFPQSKIICLMLLTRLGLYCSDAVNIERIVPMLLVAIEDPCATVRAMSLRALRSLLALVTEFSNLECNIFPLYIFPALSRIAKDTELVVRVAFAESIGLFAEISKKFLDRTHYQILSSSNEEASSISEGEAMVEYPYHQKLEQLKEQISRWIRDLIIDANLSSSSGSDGYRAQNLSRLSSAAGSLVKRVLLLDIVRLCTFFGQESTMDKLLTQLLTFLNDQDWELRFAFCAKIPSVCAFLGPTITSECILPCIENAIYDVEEKVVVCAVQCLTTLAELSLLSKFIVVDFAKKCKGLLLHPSSSIRMATISFLCVGASRLGQMDSVVFLLPEIREVVSYDLTGVMEMTLQIIQNSLLPPIPRSTFRKGLFERIMNMSSFNFSVRGMTSDMLRLKDDPETLRKVSVMASYLDFAAAEINTKTLQWRNSTSASMGTAFIDSIRQRLVSNSDFTYKSRLDSLLDNFQFTVPDHALQCLLIPHQKYGIFYFPSLPEDLRRNTLYIDNDGSKNSNKLKMLFGVTASQADAARALAAGSSDVWETQQSNTSLNPVQSNASVQTVRTQRSKAVNNRASIESLSNPTPSSGSAANQIMLKLRNSAQPAFSESVVLLKRIKALAIPPLPVDVGMLCQPDDRKFRYAFPFFFFFF